MLPPFSRRPMRKASGLVVPLEGAIPAFAQNPWRLAVLQCSQCSASHQCYSFFFRTLWLFLKRYQTSACCSAVKMLRPLALAAACITAAALVAQRTPATATDDALANLRRAMAQKQPVSRKTFGTASIAAAVTAFARVAEVDASGGATAGGAYLLRAKERYNARVTEGAKAYKKSTDIAALFAEKDGALDDLEAAGFLLANAFRINSTQNPDKILQVQKFKAFKKDADACAALLKKKKTDAAAAYDASLVSLDAYLSSVGL